MAEGLNYKVGLDAQGFQAGVGKVTAGFTQIEASSRKATTAIVKSTAAVPTALNGIQKPAANAGFALNSLSQVARDLPFGFIAIQNNLPVVVDAFQSLSKQSGGTLNALKGLGGALLGPAGIGFAFSAVTSSVTALIQKYGSLSAGLSNVFGLVSASTRAQIALNKATDEASAATTGEVIKLNSLTSALTDNSRPQAERKNAYAALKKEYPGIIQNMTFENSLTEQGTNLIKQRAQEVLKYISLKGREAAIIKLIEEASLKQIQAQRKLRESVTGENQSVLDKSFTAFSNAFNVGDSFQSLAKDVKGATSEIDSLSKELQKTSNEILKLDSATIGIEPVKAVKEKSQKELNELLKSRITLLQSELELEKDNLIKRYEIRSKIINLQEALDRIEAQQTIKNKEALINELKAIDNKYIAERRTNQVPVSNVATGDPLSGVPKGTEAQFQKFRERITALTTKIPVTIDITGLKPQFTAAELLAMQFAAEVEAILSDFSRSVQNVLQDGAINAIGNVGSAIGDLASGGGFKGLGKVFEGVGETIQQIGRYAIQTGVQILALKKAFKFATSNPALLIGAGIALTALGAVVKNKFSKTAGLAQGGIVPAGFPNDSFPARLTSNEAVIPLDRLEGLVGGIGGGGGTLTTQVSGDNLLFILNRAERRQGRGL